MPARLRLTVAVVIALTLVCGGAWAGWARRHPHVLPDHSGAVEFLRLAKVGQTAYFDAVDLAASMRQVRFRSATPQAGVNTAEATFEVLVCTPRAGRGGGIGVVSGRAAQRYCDLAPISGAVVDQPRTAERQIVLAITPRRAGRVQVVGLDIGYDAGWRSGTQHVAIRVGLRAR